ncbi:hypothetical protein C4552_02140 [Candidatus Parcubacteria bacterium]|nr:MAG: hypothetical protein C4552_02140 [Candidatus Parcubacteria bacterium]
MAVMAIRMRWNRGFAPWKQALGSVIGLGLAGFLVFVDFFATRQQLRYIGAHDIDKIPHFFGGVLIALAYEWFALQPRLWRLMIVTLAVTVSWEVYEYYFDDDVRYYALHMTEIWQRDVIRDIAVAFFGSILWWFGFADRDEKK